MKADLTKSFFIQFSNTESKPVSRQGNFGTRATSQDWFAGIETELHFQNCLYQNESKRLISSYHLLLVFFQLDGICKTLFKLQDLFSRQKCAADRCLLSYFGVLSVAINLNKHYRLSKVKGPPAQPSLLLASKSILLSELPVIQIHIVIAKSKQVKDYAVLTFHTPRVVYEQKLLQERQLALDIHSFIQPFY